MWVERMQAIGISILDRGGAGDKREKERGVEENAPRAIGITRADTVLLRRSIISGTLTIRCMQSASISLCAATKKQRHYVCVRIRDLDPRNAFPPYVVGTSVCGLFRDKLQGLRTSHFRAGTI